MNNLFNKPTNDIPLYLAKDIWLDDENDLIRSCGALSRALGKDKVRLRFESETLEYPHGHSVLQCVKEV